MLKIWSFDYHSQTFVDECYWVFQHIWKLKLTSEKEKIIILQRLFSIRLISQKALLYEPLAVILFKETMCYLECSYFMACTQEWDKEQQSSSHSYGYIHKILEISNFFSYYLFFHFHAWNCVFFLKISLLKTPEMSSRRCCYNTEYKICILFFKIQNFVLFHNYV